METKNTPLLKGWGRNTRRTGSPRNNVKKFLLSKGAPENDANQLA